MRKFLEWVIILYKDNTSNSHAKGLKVCKKFIDTWEEGDGIQIDEIYKYGSFNVWKEDIKEEWSLNSFPLEWNSLEKPYIPTFKEKLLKKLWHKNYSKTVDVRPKDDTIVIMNYSNDHYEVAEYNDRCWITDLSFPCKPDTWAYMPEECIKLAKESIKQKETNQ